MPNAGLLPTYVLVSGPKPNISGPYSPNAPYPYAPNITGSGAMLEPPPPYSAYLTTMPMPHAAQQPAVFGSAPRQLVEQDQTSTPSKGTFGRLPHRDSAIKNGRETSTVTTSMIYRIRNAVEKESIFRTSSIPFNLRCQNTR